MNILITTVDKDNSQICIQPSVVEIYPNHLEWVEKCINELRTCFLAKDKSNIIGCAITKPSMKFAGKMKLCFLFILPSYRNRGVASQLLLEIEKYARSLNLKYIYITVDKRVSDVKAFLFSHGFFPVGTTKIDEDVYEKTIMATQEA